jgi:hypothetical protein
MLKAIVTEDEFKALSDSDKAHYVKKNGKYHLSVEGVDGFKLEDVNALNTALERERENFKEAKKAKADLEAKLEGLDIDEAKRLIERKKSGKGAPDDAELQSAIAQAIDKEQKAHTATKSQLELTRNQLNHVMIESEAMAAIVAEEGFPNLLKPHVTARCKLIDLEDGKVAVRVVDEKGQVRMSMLPDNNGPMGIRELVSSMKKDPTFQPGFKGKGANGLGRDPAGGPLGDVSDLSADPKSPKFNLTELSKLQKSNPAQYKKLLDEYRSSQRAAAH